MRTCSRRLTGDVSALKKALLHRVRVLCAGSAALNAQTPDIAERARTRREGRLGSSAVDPHRRCRPPRRAPQGAGGGAPRLARPAAARRHVRAVSPARRDRGHAVRIASSSRSSASCVDEGPWRDVFLNVRLARALELRAGKFKMPFGLEETTSTMDLDFAYRTLGSDALAPAREIGAMAHGRVTRLLEYEAGVFRGDGENARSSAAGVPAPGRRGARARPLDRRAHRRDAVRPRRRVAPENRRGVHVEPPCARG